MSEPLLTADVIEQLLNAESGADELPPPGWRDPSLAKFQPFPVDALPTCIGQFVSSVSGATGTDPSWAALAALVILAGCIGNRVAVILKKGWVEPAILWAALVGKSGSNKSVVLRLLIRPLVKLFKQERDAFNRRMNDYFAALARYGVELREWKGAQKDGPPTDPPLEPEKPKEKRVLVSDITIEKLAALLGDNPLGLLVVRDELAGLVNSFDRYAGGKGSDLQSWLSMNDAGSLLVDRKSDGSTFVEKASVSLLGTIQPFTLEKVFGVAEREAGLLARVMLAYPPHKPALWTDDELPEDMESDWGNLLAGLLSLQPARDEADRPKPRLIGLSHEAKVLFVAWHNRHANEVANLGNDHLRAHWAKLKGMCARVALVFACSEVVMGQNISSISADCIARAIRITEWLKQESARIYGGMSASQEERDTQRLLEWIESRGGTVTIRDVTHGNWKYRGDAESARLELEALVQAAIGRWVIPPSAKAGGRPSDKFELLAPQSLTITKTPTGDPTKGGFGDGDVGERENSSNSSPDQTTDTGS